jgi:septum formation protein
MLGLLSARQHQVHTGLALVAPQGGREVSGISTSMVHFARLTRQEIDWYVATGEGRDKAGAYAVQGLAALFIEGVEGSPSNVVGLPLELLYRKAAELGCDLKRWASGP